MTDTPDLHTLAAEAQKVRVDLAQIESEWLQQCGPCDLGMPEYGCTHPGRDYRPVMVDLVREIEALRRAIDLLPAHRRQVLEEAADRLDPGPRDHARIEDEMTSADWVKAAQRGAAANLRMWASQEPASAAPEPAEAAAPDGAEQVVQHRVVMGTVEGMWAEISDEDAARQIAETQALDVPPWRMERRVVSIGPAEVIGHGGRSTGAAAADGQDGDGRG